MIISSFSWVTALLLLLYIAKLRLADAQIGVCYGMVGNNLPAANEVIDVYRSNNIKRMRLYDSNQAALQALRNSGIELILGVPNSDLQGLATNSDSARQWVQRNVLSFWPSVKIKYIAVGNEVRPVGDSTSWMAQYVLPAIQNVYQAIRAQGLHDQIKVSTAIDMSLLGNSFPPSQASFRGDVRSYLDPIISYKDNSRDISLPYAIFTSPNVVVQDGQYGYQNLFDAMLDAVHAAIDNTGIGFVEVVVSESGWPSSGDFGATYDNARIYLDNLIRHVNGGTPRRPWKPTETYLFAMFDENQKNPELEKHFGLFFPNKQKKYSFGFGAERRREFFANEFNATVVPLLKSDI
ncbi:glucan endo-1,3-beta-glucosidase, basic isoform-like isoform X2 [Arachis stenosperma]|uniref:glucan endo-1,3-beta-glucosidase, basic isoform-like isoform X2 n=1 Tax=Arachis stenosperma TaxID=217475 RepID=UPI0025ABCE7B|nr:glucan endo-1,3-beta-glucosidase, basic isoform-like isoform X2 [Arachis stenosperma]